MCLLFNNILLLENPLYGCLVSLNTLRRSCCRPKQELEVLALSIQLMAFPYPNQLEHRKMRHSSCQIWQVIAPPLLMPGDQRISACQARPRPDPSGGSETALLPHFPQSQFNYHHACSQNEFRPIRPFLQVIERNLPIRYFNHPGNKGLYTQSHSRHKVRARHYELVKVLLISHIIRPIKIHFQILFLGYVDRAM